MKNIVWKKKNGEIAITEITAPPTFESIKRHHPYDSEEVIRKILDHHLSHFPISSEHHANQLRERSRLEWENNGSKEIERPDILDWEVISYDDTHYNFIKNNMEK